MAQRPSSSGGGGGPGAFARPVTGPFGGPTSGSMAGVQQGFNHNLRYRGVVFHAQTEDAGREVAQVRTHLFHGGNVIDSIVGDYSPWLAEPDVPARVRHLMVTQHKAIMRRLIRGELDAQIAARVGVAALTQSMPELPSFDEPGLQSFTGHTQAGLSATGLTFPALTGAERSPDAGYPSADNDTPVPTAAPVRPGAPQVALPPVRTTPRSSMNPTRAAPLSFPVSPERPAVSTPSSANPSVSSTPSLTNLPVSGKPSTGSWVVSTPGATALARLRVRNNPLTAFVDEAQLPALIDSLLAGSLADVTLPDPVSVPGDKPAADGDSPSNRTRGKP